MLKSVFVFVACLLFSTLPASLGAVSIKKILRASGNMLILKHYNHEHFATSDATGAIRAEFWINERHLEGELVGAFMYVCRDGEYVRDLTDGIKGDDLVIIGPFSKYLQYNQTFKGPCPPIVGSFEESAQSFGKYPVPSDIFMILFSENLEKRKSRDRFMPLIRQSLAEDEMAKARELLNSLDQLNFGEIKSQEVLFQASKVRFRAERMEKHRISIDLDPRTGLINTLIEGNVACVLIRDGRRLVGKNLVLEGDTILVSFLEPNCLDFILQGDINGTIPASERILPGITTITIKIISN